MLKKVGAMSAIAAVFAVLVATTLGGTASAKTTKTAALCKKAGLGFAGPLSGGAAFLGTDQSNWVKLFISSWNSGKKIPGVPKGLHRVKLNLAYAGDSQLSPQVAATVARHMVSIKSILGMVGFAGSNENLGGGPVLDGAHLAYVSGSATLDTLATGAPGGQKPLKDFFRVVPQNAQQARSGVPYIIKTLGLKKGAKVMIVDDGEAYGIGLSGDAQKIFKSKGMNVTRKSVKETDQNPGGATGFANDIAPVAQQAVADGVKLVYAPTQDAPDSQTFATDLKIDGYHGGFMATDGSVSPTQFKFPGAYISFFGPSLAKITKSFRTAYLHKYGANSASDPFGAPSFVAAEMLGVAISKTCAATHNKSVSRAAVVKKLKKVSLSSTILGYSMAFNNPADAHHGPKVGVTVFKIAANGAYKEVFPK
jgi:branched-chain amino acid transport system substrate-binding protein